jgi:hypothetical protein
MTNAEVNKLINEPINTLIPHLHNKRVPSEGYNFNPIRKGKPRWMVEKSEE